MIKKISKIATIASTRILIVIIVKEIFGMKEYVLIKFYYLTY